MGLTSYSGGYAVNCCYQIDTAAVAEVIDDIDNSNGGPVLEILLSTPGGGVLAGLALYDYLRWQRHRGVHVTISVLGLAASIAPVILQAADHRVIGAESYLLIHPAEMAAEDEDSELTGETPLIQLVQAQIVRILAARSHLTDTDITHRMAGGWWLTAKAALEHGLVDEIR